MAINEHVTAEQYAQSLRDQVNAYYEHALNDPGMSREEAISSTAEMAERALAATEAFQAEMEAQEASVSQEAAAAQETPGQEAGEAAVSQEAPDNSGGVDGGDTGGVDGGEGGIE